MDVFIYVYIIQLGQKKETPCWIYGSNATRINQRKCYIYDSGILKYFLKLSLHSNISLNPHHLKRN